LSVDVQEIDKQHQILIGLLNQLHKAIAMQTDDNEIQMVIY
jgi:hemerythrin